MLPREKFYKTILLDNRYINRIVVSAFLFVIYLFFFPNSYFSPYFDHGELKYGYLPNLHITINLISNFIQNLFSIVILNNITMLILTESNIIKPAKINFDNTYLLFKIS